MTLATGAILHNRYRIAKLVGQGGFGAVYRAWDMSLNRPVAVKENFDTGPQSQRQFEREAQLLAGLRHPNLPVVGDYFILPGQGQYLVMDFVEGKSLDTLLNERGGPLDEAEVLPWIRQVCDALDYLHTQTPPIIHRDIKPENIIITDKGRAMLVDFGISKAYDPNKGTTIGAKAVTPGYSPPEQYGRGRTDARSDVYALGATLYTLLTGRVPPEGPDLSSGADVLIPPHQVNPAVSVATSAAIVAAMVPTISKRLESAVVLNRILSERMPSSLPATPAIMKRTLTLPMPINVPSYLPKAADEALPKALSYSTGTPVQAPASTAQSQAAGPIIVQDLALSTIKGDGMSPTWTVAVGILVLLALAVWTVRWMEFGSQPPANSQEPVIQTQFPAGYVRRVTRDGFKIEEVYVPAGSFWMGSAQGEQRNEQPLRLVILNEFWLDRTEVTNVQYERCVDAGKCAAPSSIHSRTRMEQNYFTGLYYMHFPIINVTWHDAEAFCAWTGGRLPTEAEWEYAARGPKAFHFPWGNQRPEHGQANLLGWEGDTIRVGQRLKDRSWVGAMDMAGNVREWINDWFGNYTEGPVEDPTGPESGRARVVRGGAWITSDFMAARSAARGALTPDASRDFLGFRCVHN